MDTRELLLDLHDRASTALERLYDHVASFEADAIEREFDGFGYPTIRAQLHHIHGSVRYWIGVFEGRMDIDEDLDQFRDLGALAQFREAMRARVREFIEKHDTDALDTPVTVTTWGGHEHEIAPRTVILRLQTHQFQHQGQITAMCRLLGSPVNGLDLPVK